MESESRSNLKRKLPVYRSDPESDHDDKRARRNVDSDNSLHHFGSQEQYLGTKRLETIKGWLRCGNGRVFGSLPQRLYPKDVLSSRMRQSIHGWKHEDGFLIPFFGVVLFHPQVFLLTTGTKHHATQFVLGFQNADKELSSRFAFTICRRDCDVGQEASLIFVNLAVKASFYSDVRKPYILADLAGIMEFLKDYKRVIGSVGDPPTIDVAFSKFLKDNPQIPHPPSFTLPMTAGKNTSADINRFSGPNTNAQPGRKQNGRMNSELDQGGSMSPFLPYRSHTASALFTPSHSCFMFDQFPITMGHPPIPSTQLTQTQTSSQPPASPLTLPVSTQSQSHTLVSRIAFTDSSTDVRLEHFGTSSQPARLELEFPIPSAPSTGIGHDIRRLLMRRYTNLYTRVQLCEMLERDFNIFTTDKSSDFTYLPDIEPLVGLDRSSRRFLTQRYRNLSMVKLCEMLDEDLDIFTRD